MRPLAALALILIGIGLAGCGKQGAPSPPEGETNTYPRIYPNPEDANADNPHK